MEDPASKERDDGLRFGRVHILPASRRLLIAGVPAKIGARAFDLLLALVERHERVVPKSELIDLVWPDVVVEDNNLEVHVSALRKLLGRDTVLTVSGRGYRFFPPLDAVDASASVAASAGSGVPPNNLPQALTNFIGREGEIAQIAIALRSARVLTLTGSGGCGKTRLSIRVAETLLSGFPQGAWLVELAGLGNPELVPQTIVGVLGLSESSHHTPTQVLAKELASRRLLLVLDNAEHLVAACAAVVDAVLRNCANVVILVTSREALGLIGEHVYRVPSLATPKTSAVLTEGALLGFDATRLFIERVRLQVPGFAVTPGNSTAVVSICARLDGIPLAIEMAAARMRSLSIEELHQRLDQRFDLLTGGSRTALPRHQTLRSLIDWSHDLLDAAERTLLARVSVFANGWTLPSAEGVCSGPDLPVGQVLPLLTSLADKSLVVAETRDGVTRYRLLETVLHYARERLTQAGELQRLQTLHCACFLELAEEAELRLTGPEQRGWLSRLDVEHDNLRAALAWSLAAHGDAISGLCLAGALGGFWSLRDHNSEGRDWLVRMLAVDAGSQPSAPRAKALQGAGALSYSLSDYPAARRFEEEALALYRGLNDPARLANLLGSLASTAHMQAAYAEARNLNEESLAIRRTLGDGRSIARSLFNLAALAAAQSDFGEARRLYLEGLPLRRAAGDERGVARTLLNLGVVAYDLSDWQSARTYLNEAAQMLRDLDDQENIASAAMHLGNIALELGHADAAMAHYRESWVLAREVGDLFGIADLLLGLAFWRATQGEPLAAARLYGAAEKLREDIGAPMEPCDRPRHERRVAAVRAACTHDLAFDRAWAEGRRMRLDDAAPSVVEGAHKATLGDS